MSTIPFTIDSTQVTYHYTQYPDTIVTETTTTVVPFTSSVLVTFDLAATLPSNNNNAAPTPTQSELSGVEATVTYAQTVYAILPSKIVYVELIDPLEHRQPTFLYTERQKSSLCLL